MADSSSWLKAYCWVHTRVEKAQKCCSEEGRLYLLEHSLSARLPLPLPLPLSAAQWQVPGATEMSGIPRNQFAMAKYRESHP